MKFVPDEIMHAIASCEAVRQSVTVFVNALEQIGCYSHVQRPIAAAGEKIHAGLFIHANMLSRPCELDSGNPCRNDRLE